MRRWEWQTPERALTGVRIGPGGLDSDQMKRRIQQMRELFAAGIIKLSPYPGQDAMEAPPRPVK